MCTYVTYNNKEYSSTKKATQILDVVYNVHQTQLQSSNDLAKHYKISVGFTCGHGCQGIWPNTQLFNGLHPSVFLMLAIHLDPLITKYYFYYTTEMGNS